MVSVDKRDLFVSSTYSIVIHIFPYLSAFIGLYMSVISKLSTLFIAINFMQSAVICFRVGRCVFPNYVPYAALVIVAILPLCQR